MIGFGWINRFESGKDAHTIIASATGGRPATVPFTPGRINASCQKAMNARAVNRAAEGLAAQSVRTGGYCRAR